jgi:hypothetical protein
LQSICNPTSISGQELSPSWQLNNTRFEHITCDHKYAHPTVRHANRLCVTRFFGDALA